MNYKQIDIETAWTLFCCGAGVERAEVYPERTLDQDVDWGNLEERYGGSPEDGKDRFIDCYSYISPTNSHYIFRVQVE